MKKIFSYLKKYKWKMTLGLSLKMIGTFAELFLPLIMAHMIDNIAPTKNTWQLIIWSVVMLLCAVIAWLFNVLANRMASKVARNTTERLRDDLFAKTLSLSARQIDEVSLPSLVSRLSSDTYNVHNMIGMMQRLGVRAPILLIGGIALTFSVDTTLALILLFTVPFLTLIVIFISAKGIKLFTNLQKSSDSMVRKVRDDYTGIRVIKALSKIDYESDSFKTINDTVVKNEIKATLTMGISNPLLNAILNLGMCAVIFIGAYRVSEGYVKVGDIIAFTSYFTIILNAVISISRIFVILTRGGASAKRISEILNLDEELTIEQNNNSYQEKIEDYIYFKNVSLSYNNFKALDNISFKLKKNESLGIIGATGSGKSSIISLLLRFYDPDTGTIYLDGKNLKEYDSKELKNKIGIVFQNDFLMAGTIKENIDFERNLPIKQIVDASKKAKASTFIEEHGGLDGKLTVSGANFSGGQKQRLLIARALASNPELLILDDSSSALDYKTDASLRKTLLENYKNTTIIMIAQRISSVKFADHILVLDKGKIVGFGSNEELMETCPTYQSIYLSQHEDDLKGGEVYGN